MTTIINIANRNFQTANRPTKKLRNVFHAYASFRRFKSLEPHMLRDMGLTQADVDATSFAEFLAQPRR